MPDLNRSCSPQTLYSGLAVILRLTESWTLDCLLLGVVGFKGRFPYKKHTGVQLLERRPRPRPRSRISSLKNTISPSLLLHVILSQLLNKRLRLSWGRYIPSISGHHQPTTVRKITHLLDHWQSIQLNNKSRKATDFYY